MPEPAVSGGLRQQLIGLGGVVERNAYLIKRYGWWELAFFIWTVANTLTIVFIAKGVRQPAATRRQRVTTSLLIGAVIWSYLGIIFEILTETVAWERWEGTIDTRSWRPCRARSTSAGWASSRCSTGCRARAAVRGHRAVLWSAPARPTSSPRCAARVASLSFVGVGMVTAVLPLISPEKGAQFGFIAQGLLLVVSGVYYPVSVLPQWMQWWRRSHRLPMRCAAFARRS